LNNYIPNKKNLYFLNSKERREIIRFLESQFNYKGRIDEGMLMNWLDDVFIVSTGIKGIDLEKLRIKKIGIQLGRVAKEELILTIEGAQLVGNDCAKNIIDISDVQAKLWFEGRDIGMNLEDKKMDASIYLIRNNGDFIGCAKFRQEKLINNVLRDRRQEIH